MLHRIFGISRVLRLGVRHNSSDKAAKALKDYNDAMAAEIAHAGGTIQYYPPSLLVKSSSCNQTFKLLK